LIVTVLISLILEAPGDGVLPRLCGMVVPFDSRSLRT
jgi:hypothetical protein